MSTRRYGDLPQYRVRDIPDGLATKTQLAARRLRLADGQRPVAMLFYHGNQHAPLYKITDAVALPELSPARAAAYAAARTCHRCARTAIFPLDRVHGGPHAGKRTCPSCAQLDARARELAHGLAARVAAVAWARGVLADANVALVAECRHQTYAGAYEVHAEALTGQVLVSAVLDTPGHSERPPRATPADVVEPQLRALGGYRLIGLGHNLFHTWHCVQRALPDAVLPDLTAAAGDNLLHQWAAWRCIAHWQAARDQRLPDQPATAMTATARRLLEQIAADTDHPDGPPVCPVLPDTGTTPCGTPHPCPTHTPEPV